MSNGNAFYAPVIADSHWPKFKIGQMVYFDKIDCLVVNRERVLDEWRYDLAGICRASGRYIMDVSEADLIDSIVQDLPSHFDEPDPAPVSVDWARVKVNITDPSEYIRMVRGEWIPPDPQDDPALVSKERPAPKYERGDIVYDSNEHACRITYRRWMGATWAYEVDNLILTDHDGHMLNEDELFDPIDDITALKAEVERLTAIAQALAGDGVDVGTLQPPKHKTGDVVRLGQKWPEQYHVIAVSGYKGGSWHYVIQPVITDSVASYPDWAVEEWLVAVEVGDE